MRKVTLTTLGVLLLIAGSAGQAVSASEHHVRRAYRAPVDVQDSWNFRGAYNGPVYQSYESLGERNRENFGFSGFDPSRIGDYDPSLRPGS